MNKRPSGEETSPAKRQQREEASFEPSSIPAHVWIDHIFSKLPVASAFVLPQVCGYFRDLLAAEPWFRANWAKYSTADLNPAFASQRWLVLRSLVFGRCLFCAKACYNFHVRIPAYVCPACSQRHPWMAAVPVSQISTQFHITKKQATQVATLSNGFSASNFHSEPGNLNFIPTHIRYLKREIALHVYDLFGGKESWLAHWTEKERIRTIRFPEKLPLLDISQLP